MFSHRKPHINVGTIGHADHDETTLTAAIIKTLGRKLGSTITIYDEIDNSPKEKVYGITISTAHVEYETAAHHYSQVDFSSHGDYIKKILSGPVQIDIAILVMSATGGRMPQTREQILLARQAGVPDIVVFLNKCDMVDVLDMYIRAPVQAVSHPFLMLVEDVLYVTGRGTVATGRVERGMILVGDEVEVMGFGATVWTTCAGMEAFRKKLDAASANEIVGILLRDTKREDVGRGHVLAMPGTTGIYANSERKYTCGARMRAVATRHSPTTIGRSFTSTWRT
jgi:elongation factor Tu